MRAVLVTVGLLVASRAGAEPRGVTLAEVVTAVNRAPAGQVTRHEVAAASSLVDAAGAWPNPEIRVETHRLTAQLVAGAVIPLPVFGTVGAAKRVAAARADVVRSEAQLHDRELVKTAIAAWIALARSDGEAAAAATAATQASELERIARGRLDAGAGAEVDVSAAVAARARATLAVGTAKRIQETRAAELAGLLGWDPAQPLVAAGDLPGRDAGTIEALRQQLGAHPERTAAQAKIREAEATIDQARKGRWPSLAVEGQVSMFDPETPGTDVLVALLIELPVFARSGDRTRAARATAAAERARLAATEAQLGGTLVAAYRRWQAASETIAALETDIVPAQERAARLSAQAYREGSRDLASALQADRDLAAVRAELNTARADVATAWLELQIASGHAL